MVRKGLGKGLSALLSDVREPDSVVALERIVPNPEQPRQRFQDDTLQELADSIRQHGVLQPLLVTPLADGRFLLVAGERRWRASRLAGLSEVPVMVRQLSERDQKLLALVENLQREDLNPVEEALGFQRLTGDMSHKAIAEAVGKARATVSNSLRLLELPEEVLGLIREGQLSAGHGRALLGLPADGRLVAARKAVHQGWSVRQVEALAAKKPGKSVPIDQGLSQCLKRKVGCHAQVRVSSEGKGSVTLRFDSPEQWAKLKRTLGL